MSATTSRLKAASYHHGGLFAASLEIALEMLRTEVDLPSIRSVARRTGVSATALYHHYPSRACLLAAAGKVGFQRVVLLLPAHGSEPSPADAFGTMVQRYVDFAAHNRLLWNLMFDGALKSEQLELRAAASEAFGILKRWLTQNFSLPDDADRDHRLLCLWSLIHGMAGLRLSHLFGPVAEHSAGEVSRSFAANLQSHASGLQALQGK